MPWTTVTLEKPVPRPELVQASGGPAFGQLRARFFSEDLLSRCSPLNCGQSAPPPVPARATLSLWSVSTLKPPFASASNFALGFQGSVGGGGAPSKPRGLSVGKLPIVYQMAPTMTATNSG